MGVILHFAQNDILPRSRGEAALLLCFWRPRMENLSMGSIAIGLIFYLFTIYDASRKGLSGVNR
jgi:hypothetical protein